MAAAVAARFPDALVVAVDVPEYHNGVFARFTGFLPPEDMTRHGEPRPDRRPTVASAHARLQDILATVAAQEREVDVSGLPLVLAGFSKGAVVLTRLVQELPLRQPGQGPRIAALHFLDAGLNTPGSMPSDASDIALLAQSGIQVPRALKSKRRKMKKRMIKKVYHRK